MSTAPNEGKPILKSNHSHPKERRGSKSENYLTKKDPENSRQCRDGKVTDQDDPWGWDDMYGQRRQVEPINVYPTGKEAKEYLCTTLLIRKWLIAGLVLQAICFMCAMILWSFVYFIWPLTFALDVQVGPSILRNRFLILVLAAEPLYNLILLIIAVTATKKMKWLIRVYYLISPILLLLVVLAGILGLFFVGNYTKYDVQTHLTDSLQLSYEGRNVSRHKHPRAAEHSMAHKGWDDLQNYLQCCGVNEYADWRYAFIDATELDKWHIPGSCCLVHKSGKRTNCSLTPEKTNTWPKGCLEPAYELFMFAGYLTVTLSLVIIIVTIGCIVAAAEFYSSLRRGDGTGYYMSTKTYCKEFFFCRSKCCKCCKSKSKVQPAPDEVRTVDSNWNVDDVGYQTDVSSDIGSGSQPVTSAPASHHHH